MDKVTRYAALNTKIRVLEGRLLKKDDYRNLLNKKSVPEITAYLKNETHYNEVLHEVNENSIHRSKLENFVKDAQVKDIDKIVHFFIDDYKEFLVTILVKYEIEDLKVVLRAIKTGDTSSIDKDSLVHIGVHSNLKKDTLLQSKSISDFIRCLKDTIYYNYLKSFIDNNNETSLFRIEMTLDLAYFDLFNKRLELVDKNDRKILEHIQGINVDLLNIQWIYRGLKFYNLSPEEVFNYTIAYGYELNRKDIKDLCYTKDIENFIKKIMNTRYSFLFHKENTRDVFMERRILRYQYYNVITDLTKKTDMDISQTIGYIMLLEDEVRDIVSIIESVRYGMPTKEAEKFLIREL